jgi:hypothetical protein
MIDELVVYVVTEPRIAANTNIADDELCAKFHFDNVFVAWIKAAEQAKNARHCSLPNRICAARVAEPLVVFFCTGPVSDGRGRRNACENFFESTIEGSKFGIDAFE